MYQRWIKGMLDRMISLIGMLLLWWVFLFLALAVKLDSKGPVFFCQKRTGKDGTCFTLYKFRTMQKDAPHDVPTHLLEHPEQFITKMGRFLRKTSLDELPQLWNIFRGDMALVGPRPALFNQNDLLLARQKNGAASIRPGLTGWAQVHGRDALSISQKAAMDGYYAAHISFGMDVVCIWKTMGIVLRREGVREGKNDAA